MNYLTVIVLLVLYGSFVCGMSEKQLQAAGRLVRNTCQPKSKATNEDIDGMRKGKWDVDKTAMCYLHCVLNMNKLITKENKLNYQTGVDLANKQLPEPRKEPTLKSIEQCKDSAKTLNDKCVAAYELSKCFYESNPENYFFP